MAIEVLKRGVLRVKGWKGTCSNCYTQVFFLTEDAIRTYSCQRDGDYAVCKCPLCTDEIYGYRHTKEV